MLCCVCVFVYALECCYLSFVLCVVICLIVDLDLFCLCVFCMCYTANTSTTTTNNNNDDNNNNTNNNSYNDNDNKLLYVLMLCGLCVATICCFFVLSPWPRPGPPEDEKACKILWMIIIITIINAIICFIIITVVISYCLVMSIISSSIIIIVSTLKQEFATLCEVINFNVETEIRIMLRTPWPRSMMLSGHR